MHSSIETNGGIIFEGKIVSKKELRSLNVEDIRSLLHEPVEIYIWDMNKIIKLTGKAVFDVWKNEIQEHIYREDKPYREDYKSEYFYFASEWQGDANTKIILLRKQH